MSRSNRWMAGLAAALVLAGMARAQDIVLPSLIADHMVLQRDVPARIWGGATPGAAVEVRFAGQRHETNADDVGRWMITLDPLPAAALPRILTVRSGEETVQVRDVLVGEVWFCSGQSNMVWTVRNTTNGEAFIAGGDEPRLRMFTVPNVAEPEPQERGPGSWHVAAPKTVGHFSAVAYHFGRELLEALEVPIGLINSSWGGSTVEAWVSRPALDAVPEARPFLDAYDAAHIASRMDATEFVGPHIDDAAWETVEMPALIEDIGHDVDGMMWFRRTVEIPHTWDGRDLAMSLGAIDDNDVTYFNGDRIGATRNWQKKRHYSVAAEHVQTGSATIAIRVEDTGGAGGFSGTPDEMSLHPVDDAGADLSLAGAWRFRLVSDRPSGPVQHRPANLYNAMIHPFRHATFRGVIWYQGESNAMHPRGAEYFTIFPALIRDWRREFGAPDLPFYYVQLPNFTNNEAHSVWRYPVVRQAQLETARSVPHTGMAVILDLGEANDIHPRNKHDVGKRLARWALVDTYGAADLVKSGPLVRDVGFDDDGTVRLAFDLFGSSLALRPGDETLTGFEVAGAEGVFHPAEAKIRGDAVIVTCRAVAAPQRVRYAWRNNAVDAALVNAEGWPASPFEAVRD